VSYIGPDALLFVECPCANQISRRNDACEALGEQIKRYSVAQLGSMRTVFGRSRFLHVGVTVSVTVKTARTQIESKSVTMRCVAWRESGRTKFEQGTKRQSARRMNNEVHDHVIGY